MMTVLPLHPSLDAFLFPCLITMVQTMLNKSGKSEHLCLALDLRGIAFSFSPLSMKLAVDFSYMSFSRWDILLIYCLLTVLSRMSIVSCQMLFLYLLR